MWRQAAFGLGAVLLLAGLNSAAADRIYFKAGGSVTLELRPPFSGAVTNILWKFRGDLLAEWIDGKVDLTYYGSFNGRATLDTNTARLEIRNMIKADAGQYTLEINSRVQDQRFDAEEIEDVPEPEISARPLTCSGASERCSLVCDGLVGKAGPVTYSWKRGDGEWKESGQILPITKSETEDVKTFSCRMKNPVSEKDSEPKDNPFLPKSEPQSSGNGGLVAGIVVPIVLVLLAAGGVAFWKREYIKSKFSENTGNGNNQDEPASDPSRNKTDDNHDDPAELKRLNTGAEKP